MWNQWKRGALAALALVPALCFSVWLALGGTAMGRQAEKQLQAPGEPAAPAAVQAMSDETLDSWQVLLLCDLDDGCTAQLRSSDGTLLDEPVFSIGEAVTRQLDAGRYQVTLEPLGTAWFTLAPNGAVVDVTGPAWTDGEMLYLTDELCATLTVERYLTQEAYDTRLRNVYHYDLSLGDTVRTDALFFTDDLTPAVDGLYKKSCTFRGLPYGTYTLQENGGECVTVHLDAAQPEATVRFGISP